ncbi:MAG TPA: glycosyltransferase family 2 protein [Thermoplasmata archaeon]|nr:glycosyltransferase family 2 protein [Thermoplasmata archaeon]
MPASRRARSLATGGGLGGRGESIGEILAAIPAFNEGKTIGSVVLEARQHVDEVAVIDDGSTDNTAWIAERAGATVIRHSVNRGYGAAIRSCFDYARINGTKVLVILDGDGQHNPSAIPHVARPVIQGHADIAIGSRFLSQQDKRTVPLYRRFGIRALTHLTNLGMRRLSKVEDAQSGFRAYSRRAVDVLDPLEAGMGASAEILWDANKAGLSVKEVPIRANYSVDGSSEGPVRHAMGVVVSMLRYVETEHALAAFGLPGLLLTLLGLALGLDVVNRYYASPTNSLAIGDALLTILALIGGMMFMFTSLILHAVINANRRTL